MLQTYSAHGVRFEYPEDWELSEHGAGDEIVVTVSSPETAFWSLSLFRDHPEPQRVVDAVVETFREEYANLDIYEADEDVCSQPALGCDIEFFCLELLNSAWVRAFEARDFTVLVLYQATDHELDEIAPIFHGITESLACEAPPDLDGNSDEAFREFWN